MLFFFENLFNKKSLDRSAVNPVLSVSFHLILDHEIVEENKSNEKVEYKIITTMADISEDFVKLSSILFL